MDSKSLSISGHHYLSQIQWASKEGTEWVFVGNGAEFNSQLVRLAVREHFGNAPLYLIADRHTAFNIEASTAADEIGRLLLQCETPQWREITLWSLDFQNAILFNAIGVMKAGRIPGAANPSSSP